MEAHDDMYRMAEGIVVMIERETETPQTLATVFVALAHQLPAESHPASNLRGVSGCGELSTVHGVESHGNKFAPKHTRD